MFVAFSAGDVHTESCAGFTGTEWHTESTEIQRSRWNCW